MLIYNNKLEKKFIHDTQIRLLINVLKNRLKNSNFKHFNITMYVYVDI